MDEFKNRAIEFVLFKQISKEIHRQKNELIQKIEDIIVDYEINVIDKMGVEDLKAEKAKIENSRITCTILKEYLRLCTQENIKEPKPRASRQKRKTKKKKKTVQRICTDTGKVLKEYQSVNQAAMDLCVKPHHIYRALRKETDTSYGYKWEYKEPK